MRVVARGTKDQAWWAQTRCGECQAWLAPMPDRWEEWKETAWDRDPDCPICEHMDEPDYAPKHDCSIKRTFRGWTYIWRCVRCGSEREEAESTPPDEWGPDPNPTSEPHEPGKIDKHLSRDPDDWPQAEDFTQQQKALVRAAAQHAWDIRKREPKHWEAMALTDALDLRSFPETIEAAQRYLLEESALPEEGEPGEESAKALRAAYEALGRPFPQRTSPEQDRFLYRLARAEDVCRAATQYLEEGQPAFDAWLRPLFVWRQYVPSPSDRTSPKAPFGGERGRLLTKRLRIAEEVCWLCDLDLGADTFRELQQDWENIKEMLERWNQITR